MDKVRNLQNRFTGWKDVTLTDEGKKEALFAAEKIKENQILIDSMYCSILERAIETAKIVCDQIDFSKIILYIIGDLMKDIMGLFKV